jgi:hypothetical protein
MKILQTILNMPVPVTNLYLVRISLILLCVGVAVMALTTTIPGAVTGERESLIYTSKYYREVWLIDPNC